RLSVWDVLRRVDLDDALERQSRTLGGIRDDVRRRRREDREADLIGAEDQRAEVADGDALAAHRFRRGDQTRGDVGTLAARQLRRVELKGVRPTEAMQGHRATASAATSARERWIPPEFARRKAGAQRAARRCASSVREWTPSFP